MLKILGFKALVPEMFWDRTYVQLHQAGRAAFPHGTIQQQLAQGALAHVRRAHHLRQKRLLHSVWDVQHYARKDFLQQLQMLAVPLMRQPIRADLSDVHWQIKVCKTLSAKNGGGRGGMCRHFLLTTQRTGGRFSMSLNVSTIECVAWASQ